MATLHFVPATYLRLAEDRLEDSPGSGRLVERTQRISEIDLIPDPTPGGKLLQVRPNDAARHAAALTLRLAPAIAAEATLEGGGARRRLSLPEGHGVFLGLEPGIYELTVEAGGRRTAHKKLTFRDRVLAELEVAGRRRPGRGRKSPMSQYDHRAIEAKWQDRWEKQRDRRGRPPQRPRASSTC